MPTKTYTLELKGKGVLSDPRVLLEGKSINVRSFDGQVTWSAKGLALEVDEVLNIEMSCKALTGTGWTFFVMDDIAQVKVYTAEGKTGEKLKTRNGRRINGYSERVAVYDYATNTLLA